MQRDALGAQARTLAGQKHGGGRLEEEEGLLGLRVLELADVVAVARVNWAVCSFVWDRRSLRIVATDADDLAGLLEGRGASSDRGHCSSESKHGDGGDSESCAGGGRLRSFVVLRWCSVVEACSPELPQFTRRSWPAVVGHGVVGRRLVSAEPQLRLSR